MKTLTALHWGEAQLAPAGVDNPRVDADLLLAFVLGVRRDELYLERDLILSPAQLERYQNLISRRVQREPLQYIVQHQEFMGLDFYVDKRVLIPRADSEILVETWLALTEKVNLADVRVLDLCTGSGALAIAMAWHRKGSYVVGTDLSADAIEVARLNARRLDVEVEWRQGDLVQPVQDERWDWIVANPPYVTVAEYAECAPEIYHEPVGAFLGGQDGLAFYRRLLNEAIPLLNEGGHLLLEIGWQQAEAIRGIFGEKGWDTRVFKDLAGRDRVILVR